MRIPPLQEIVVADVHSSGIADLAVDDGDFAVVAIIELCAESEQIESRPREFHDLDASLLHFVIVERAYVDIGDIFMYEPDLYAFSRLFHQQFLDFPASAVPPEIEIFHMDVFPGIFEIPHQSGP